MKIEVRENDLDPWKELDQYQNNSQNLVGKYGATSVFIGTMRDFNENENVVGMTLEYYPGMTEKYLQQIVMTAMNKWSILDAMVIHRAGNLRPHDPIVLVAVWSAHRGAAYDANRFIMEELKSTAPFWKKETLDDGVRWLHKNTVS